MAVAAALAVPSAAGGKEPIAAAEFHGALATVERVLALSADRKLQSPEARTLVSGEFADIPAETLGKIGKPDLVVAAQGGAVVRAPASADFIWDVYFYLKRSGAGWTVDAVRALHIPQFVGQVREELRAKPDRDAEEDAALRNLDLVFTSDAGFRVWFGAHRGDLDAMLKGDDTAAQATATRLNGTVFDSTGPYPRFIIGGIMDNSVGFLFVGDGERPPAISPSDYIWIEPMGGGWYLYRTT